MSRTFENQIIGVNPPVPLRALCLVCNIPTPISPNASAVICDKCKAAIMKMRDDEVTK